MASARPFQYHRGELQAGAVPLTRLAQRFGTPLYVYDFGAIADRYRQYERGLRPLPHVICASVKANSNLALLRRLAAWGSGFDVVSGGELERVLHAGGGADRIVFSGVGKTAAEMDAALRAGILLFNVESEPELELLAERAQRLRRRARFGLRVNPDVAASTHPHIATGRQQHKFGVDAATARRLYRAAPTRWLEPAGISFHIGSQILDTAPFVEAVRRVAALTLELRRAGVRLRLFDVGGGLGIAYRPEQRPPSIAQYLHSIRSAIPAELLCPDFQLLIEPGRGLVAGAGALLTRVLYVKESGGKRFLITDAASNDLIRPALYGAYHEIVPVQRRRGRARPADVVGPVCESGDVFAQDRPLPPVGPGDLLAILDAGAYGFVLASNYNSRPRAAEVAIEHGRARAVRRRETITDLLGPELSPRAGGGGRIRSAENAGAAHRD